MPKKIILCDIDGVIADVSRRQRHVTARPKNWKAFFAEIGEDTLNEWAAEILRRFAPDHEIVLLTGRPEEHRAATEAWLSKHGVPYARLLMRGKGDFRKDTEVKREIVRADVDRERVRFVLEDRTQNAEMFRDEGLTILQVRLRHELGESAP